MTSPITADAGPLIGLARAEILQTLPRRSPAVEVPAAFVYKLRFAEDRPYSRALREAQAAGWLVTVALKSPKRVSEFEQVVDRGEAEAILLAKERGSRLLLLVDRRRQVWLAVWALQSSKPGACSSRRRSEGPSDRRTGARPARRCRLPALTETPRKVSGPPRVE